MTDDYAKARKLGLKQVEEALEKGLSPHPPALGDLVSMGSGFREIPLGCMEIPLRLVVGTRERSRQNLFSPGFLPIASPASEFARKWESLYRSQLDEGIRDPIIAFEYRHRFYVQEGNKRVSVARFMDMPSIEAQVTRVMGELSYQDEDRVYEEFLRFWSVCPLYELDFTRPGSYRWLARLLGKSLSEPWDEDEVKRLKAAFHQFESCFDTKLGRKAGLTAADGFLIYLRCYPTGPQLAIGTDQLRQRLKELWGEPSIVTKTAKAVSSASHGAASKVRAIAQATKRSVES